jgi:anti-sigma factor RsiW
MTMTGIVSHATPTELELYVIDALAGDQRRRLEQHLSGCDQCADRLAGAAAAEMDLRALWPEVQQARRPLAAVVPLRAPRPAAVPRPAARASSGGLAVAAVALLVVGWGAVGGHRHVPAPSASVLAPGGACLASRDRVSEDPPDAEGSLCSIEPAPAPPGLASWAACASPRR